ncbi:DUF2933 domain-containing protein [Indioceanicola profundi]|uniref:DUF2933 domain-containing protein n=1 Tax=Indioceanicola profundi TaxID=2220096 RepID=UPI000E6ACE50|nr:DUF2933 domain-containing protein [Indioceanicola profundi]
MINTHPGKPWWRDGAILTAVVFLAVTGFFLWAEHRAHLFGALPYLLLLLCPLMHLFMHGGHGHGHRHGRTRRGPDAGEQS